jgi:predicted ABC-type exoprotein transport system permease subunit
MPTKIVAAIVAVALVLAYVGPMVFKMKDVPLAGVILIGIVVMLFDLWQTLQDAND